MARMTEAEKRAVPRSERGVPSRSGTGSYPMPNRAKAASAERFAAKYHGRNSSFAKRIRAKAHKLFPGMGRSKGKLSDMA